MDKFENMNRDELLYELKKSRKQVADYENIYSKNLSLNECKNSLMHFEKFDKLIYLVSSKILNIPSKKIETGILESLKLITEFTNSVRSTVYLFSPDLKQIHNSYEWSAIDSESMQNKFNFFEVEKFKFFTEMIGNKKVILVRTIDDLPDYATGEREWYAKTGFRPTIMVPLVLDEKFSGILGVYGKKDETKDWNEQLAKQLNLIGDIILSAINIDKSKKKLKSYEVKFSEFFEKATVGNVILDHKGNFKNVNLKFSKMLGYTKEELINKNIREFLFPDDISEHIYKYQQLIKNEISDYNEEIRFIKKNKEEIWTEFSLTSVSEVDDNKSGLIGVVNDITEQKKNQLAIESIIKSSSAKSGKIFFETLVKELTYVLKSDYAFVGEINHLNEDYIKTLAICENKEIVDNVEFPISKTPIEIVMQQGLCSIPKEAKKIYKNDIFIKEYQINGFVAIPLFDCKEEIIGVMGAMFTDDCPSTEFVEFILYLFATRTANELERMKNEKEMAELNFQLEEKNEELSQIIYVTSHDLRSPLVNVKGFSTELYNSVKEIEELLDKETVPENIKSDIDEILNEDISEYVKFISTSIDKMDSLLSGLLRLSRLGRAAVIFDKYDTNIIVEEVLQTLEYQIKEKKLKVQTDPLPEIYADKIQINQVFTNIIDNAIKYSDPLKESYIKISAEETINNVIIKIEDNGIGIEDKDKTKVFEVFQRINPKDDNGIGLGMALVKKIIERHSGNIWVESVFGEGTSFYFKLPIKN